MKIVGRILLGLAAVILLVVIVVGAYGVYQVRRPFPQTSGTLELAGLQDDVHVYRDELGIPHIYASNEHDLFFAQGYVHAQDRFWQMEFWRHVSAGRLSEIGGEALVSSDTFIRTMGWNRITEETTAYYEANEPEAMAILDAYSAGVNRYIEANRDNLSINATILQLVNEPWEIEPWSAKHTIGWSVVMSDDLSGNWDAEIERAQLIAAMGEERAGELLPLYPDNRPIIAPSDLLAAPSSMRPTGSARVDWSRVNTVLAGSRPENGFALGAGEWVGSNNWVIGGELTDTGSPLLADDPHLGIQMPSIWYEVGLHAPGWNVTGFSFAGVPGVVVGHNERISWGVTNGTVDVQDLYVERINPENPRQYEFEGEWRDMDVFQETIKVNGGDDVTLEVLATHHGPIINDVVDGAADVLSFRWTAAEEPSRLLLSVLALNQAQDYDDFREALRFWDVPAQNFVYADVEGNIAYQLPGRFPIRAGGSNGLTPVPGWTGEHEWEGWVPFEELPALLNPDRGFIVTANNAIVDETYPHLLDLQWDNGDRAQRIEEMIEETLNTSGRITSADIARMHMDSKSLLAEAYQPLLSTLTGSNAREEAALEYLRSWDLQLRRDSIAATIWEIFYMHLATATLSDELGQQAESYLSNRGSVRVLFHRLANDPNASLWDDVTTSNTETQDALMQQALTETITWLDTNLGENMATWQWGKLHTATFVSNPLGQSGIGPIESLVNRGPFPADGGTSAVNANSFSWSNPAAVTGHVSMRMIVDMADFERSQSIHPTGQSGHPFHPHYDDMVDMWLNGQYHPMRWDRSVVEAAATEHLVLQPEP